MVARVLEITRSFNENWSKEVWNQSILPMRSFWSLYFFEKINCPSQNLLCPWGVTKWDSFATSSLKPPCEEFWQRFAHTTPSNQASPTGVIVWAHARIQDQHNSLLDLSNELGVIWKSPPPRAAVATSVGEANVEASASNFVGLASCFLCRN